MRYDDHGITDLMALRQQPRVMWKEGPVRNWPRVRITIARLMIAVAVVAVMLALPVAVFGVVIALSIPCLSTVGARWLVFRRRRRLAAFSFWVAAAITNVFVAFFCITPNMNSTAFSLVPVALLVIAAPTILAFGTAWIVLSIGDEAIAPTPRAVPGFSVLVLAVLPIVTLWTLWPLNLAFAVARPELDRLANQVAAGMPVRFPRRVGLFKLTAATLVPVSGHVGLRIHENGASSSGFVRLNPRAIPGTYGPFMGVNFDVYLGGGWWYRG
jgi:hypothetical protein